MSVTLWVIAAMVTVALMGLAFTVGWILAHSERDRTHLMQAIIGAGFVAMAITIISIQANLVVSNQNTLNCNNHLLDALAVRDRAVVKINEAGIHFHEHLLIWLGRANSPVHQPKQTNDALIQLKASISDLIAARSDAIDIERRNPLPVCPR